ncbi:MAG TPA: hypothetical protein VH328_02365 [Burkholderiaceae bacterium]|jgi:hypothetical protein|nr:hypothetical protein [Burkholderiaceae bacterium]
MIRTYVLQTLLAVASATVTMSLLASGHVDRTPAAARACPVTQSLLAGALPLDAPPPAPPGASGTSEIDA